MILSGIPSVPWLLDPLPVESEKAKGPGCWPQEIHRIWPVNVIQNRSWVEIRACTFWIFVERMSPLTNNEKLVCISCAQKSHNRGSDFPLTDYMIWPKMNIDGLWRPSTVPTDFRYLVGKGHVLQSDRVTSSIWSHSFISQFPKSRTDNFYQPPKQLLFWNNNTQSRFVNMLTYVGNRTGKHINVREDNKSSVYPKCLVKK